MANKKKDDEIKYLQRPLPQGAKEKTTVRVNWSGLNMVQTLDTGELSLEKNISAAEAPYLVPSQKRKLVYTVGARPNNLFGFSDFLVLIHNNVYDNIPVAERIENIDNQNEKIVQGSELGGTTPKQIAESAAYFMTPNDRDDYYAANLKNDNEKLDWIKTNAAYAYEKFITEKRCVVMMSKYDGKALTGSYQKKLLFFPDRQSGDFLLGNGLNIADIPQMPMIKYATVHLSRLYGVNDERVYVSVFNDYSSWAYDTANEYDKQNAWASAAQSNVKATGDFTGLTTYLNSVVAFKRDYMHEITGSSNPFRINDVYAEGATDNRNIVEVDGYLIFVSDDAVKVYTGGNPRIISYKLGVGRFSDAVAGTDGRRYYLYCRDGNGARRFFVYDTMLETWSEEEITENVIAFAHNDIGFYMLVETNDGTSAIYRIDTGDYDGQEWAAETDITAGKTIDIKHVQKVQILADVAAGSEIRAYLLRDGERFSEKMEPIYRFKNETETTKKAALRVVPRMTAHWGSVLRLSGVGYSRIYQAELTMKGGGELYV